MTPKALINVSYCCSHTKGGDGNNSQRIAWQQHAEWLESAVDVLLEEGLPIIVSCTGFPGMTNIHNAPDCCERDVMWRVFAKVRAIIGVPQNPGHQSGAALCVRMGLEAASKLGFEYMVHTAEDVLPHQDAIKIYLDNLRPEYDLMNEQKDYAGERWGVEGDQLNSQFFACRPAALVGPFDPATAGGIGCLEQYLADLLRDRPKWLCSGGYRTTHDYAEWCRWIKERKG